MKSTKMLTILVMAVALMVCGTKVSEAEPMGTAFTYQGRLMDANSPADGLYDFEFKLYDGPADGNQQGSTIDVYELDLIDGHITVELDFGNGIFTGDRRWLEMGVRPGDSNDPNAFVILSPRVELTQTPYAIYAQTAGGVDVPLELSGSESGSHIIKGRNSSTGSSSIGVHGEATAGSGLGVYGKASGGFGYGVYGEATYENGSGRGVYGLSRGLEGAGVKGLAHNSGDYTNYGGYFQANGSTGQGVYGLAFYNGDVKNYGGYFEARGTNGHGVHGYASNTGNVVNFGGYFEAAGGRGTAVRGYASSTTSVTNRGGSFEALGSSGTGVFGLASGSSGTGVRGFASNNGDKVTNYGGSFEAAGSSGRGVYGLATGRSGRGVHGEASNTESVTNYGGLFEADGEEGYGAYCIGTGTSSWGIYGASSGNSGRGVEGHAIGPYATGVHGFGGHYNFYAANPGAIDYGSASSFRWKSKIRSIDDPLDKVLRLRGVYFNWDTEHGGHHDVGMIAEEVGQVLPEIVAYEDNGIDATGMDYSMLTPVLVEAVKQLKGENDRLKERVEALERTIHQLVKVKELEL